ncbi:MAG: hypothetical protein N3H30_02040 [Candidatus Micrarchaeota archaeon]|nr:hypothetical protein [Candidatus Micrarchaeota archaeon]
MHQFMKSAEAVEGKLRAMLGDALDDELKRVLSDYAGMIDRRAALYILALEKGAVQQPRKEISQFSELSDDLSSVTFAAQAARLFVPHETRTHKTLRIQLTDGAGGTAMLVLWDSHAEAALAAPVEPGDTIVVQNAYYRNGELHAGQYSAVRIEKRNRLVELSRATDGRCNVAVRLTSPLSVRTYVREGSERQMATGWVADHSGRVRLVAWNNAVQALANAGQGDVLRVWDALLKNGELHLNDYTRIEVNPEGCTVLSRAEDVVPGFKGMFSGALISVGEQAGQAYAVIRAPPRDIKVQLTQESLASLLGGKLSPDISFPVAAALALRPLMGRQLTLAGLMNENGIFVCSAVRPAN